MFTRSSKFYWKKQLMMLLVLVVVAGGFPATFAPQVVKAAEEDDGDPIGPVVGPGGVKDAALWLKASDGVEIGADGKVAKWTDQTAEKVFTTDERRNGVTLDKSLANFHPTVKFDGNGKMDGNDKTSMKVQEIFGIAKHNDIRTALFSTVPASGTKQQTQMFFGQDGTQTLSIYTSEDLTPVDPNFQLNGPRARFSDKLRLLAASPQKRTAWENGVTKGANESFTDKLGMRTLKLGENSHGGNPLKGHFPELIVFDDSKTLRDDEMNRISSYLALKYGVTLKANDGSSTDYVASDGTTKMWTKDDNAGYGNRITGIGRDDASGLYQKQSKSQEADANVTIALGDTIAPSNAANSAEKDNPIAKNLSFFTFSDNNGTTAFDQNFSSTNAPANLKRMARTFKVEKTEWQDTNITLALDNMEAEYDYYLLIDNQYDESLKLNTVGEVNLSSNRLTNGETFTFARISQGAVYPGGVGNGLISWVDVERSAVITGTQINKLIDLVDRGSWMPNGTPNDNVPNALNFNGGIQIDDKKGYYTRSSKEFNDDLAREIFSVQASNTYSGFPWEFGGTYNNIAVYGDANGKNIRTYFGRSEGYLDVNVGDYQLKDGAMLNVWSASDDWALSLNGKKLKQENNNTPNFTSPITNEYKYYYFGAGHNSRFYGKMVETILYNRKLNDVERNKVNSYLALKYGLTLKGDNNTFIDYVASNGSKMWTASKNIGYGNRVTGIGLDKVGALSQKQSKSQVGGANVTIALGNEIKETNALNTNDIANDKSFFIFSDNGQDAKFVTPITKDAKNLKRMERIYKVEKTNWKDTDITFAVDKVEGASDWPLYLVISSNGQFDSQVSYHQLVDGNVTLNSGVFADGVYFTIAAPVPQLVSASLEKSETDANQIVLTFDQSVDLVSTKWTGFTITVGEQELTLSDDNFQVDADGKLIITLPVGTDVTDKTVKVEYDGKGNLKGKNGVPVNTFEREAEDPFAAKLNIVEPSDIIYVTKPTISGTAEANSEVTIVILDENGYQVPNVGGTVPTDISGIWTFPLVDDLKSGKYTVKVTATNNDGKTASKNKTFTVIDKSLLEKEVERIDNLLNSEMLKAEDYTKDSWQSLMDALAAAKIVLDDPANQQAVDGALAALKSAYEELKADKSKLQQKVDAIDHAKLNEEDYTSDSWRALKDEFDNARVVLSNPKATPQEIAAAKDALDEALKALVPANAEGVNKAPLQVKVSEIELENLNEADYTQESWVVLHEALAKAREVLGDDSASQEDVNAALADLESARDALQPTVPVGVDKTVLRAKVVEINLENLNGSNYTPESWEALQEALTKAREVLANEDAIQEEVDAALSVLTAARNGLRNRDTGGDNGGDNGNSGGDNTWYPSTPAPTPPKPIIDVTKNGNQDAFATGTEQKVGSETKTYVRIDKNKVSNILSQGNGQQLSVHVPNKGNVEATGLTAADVQKLADTGSSLQVSNLLAIYPVPGGQLNLNAIANNWNNAALGDIAVQIDIQLAPNGVIDRARKQASSKGYELLVDPVDLDLTFKHDGQTIRSGLLNGYAPKYIALPDGIDLNRITTGVIVNSDGTVFHVPTVVTKIDNRYFALINDLRSSGTYSVIWNPKDFDDVKNHWAQSKVNNVSARLDLAGTGDNTWSPDRNVDRAQFATIVSYGMGIMRQDVPQNIFNDVNASAWYYPSITIANEFGIVKGYGDDTFRGNQLITREEGIAMIARAYKLVNPQAAITPAKADNELAAYGDVNEVSAWAKESVALMISAGIVEGKEGKLLKPQDYMTRAESVALLERLLKVTELIDK